MNFDKQQRTSDTSQARDERRPRPISKHVWQVRQRHRSQSIPPQVAWVREHQLVVQFTDIELVSCLSPFSLRCRQSRDYVPQIQRHYPDLNVQGWADDREQEQWRPRYVRCIQSRCHSIGRCADSDTRWGDSRDLHADRTCFSCGWAGVARRAGSTSLLGRTFPSSDERGGSSLFE